MIPRGNFSSTRYHKYLPIRREEDNVFFVSWILQLLHRIRPGLTGDCCATVDLIIHEGEDAIDLYRNRYGGRTYNFYRPKAWFPNGRILSKWGRFQPTDDSDDTSMALRGKRHPHEYALDVKKTFVHHANGKRGRWIRRGPKDIRKLKAYNTWIGSEGMFIDLDLVVMANILTFNAEYDLGRCEEDTESLRYIQQCMDTADWWKRPWSVSSWYPHPSVIVYSMADLMNTGYYPELEGYRPVLTDLCRAYLHRIERTMEEQEGSSDMHALLYSIAFHKLTSGEGKANVLASMESLIADSPSFTFGVIPLSNPWNGLLAQWLGGFQFFQMHFECEAQCVAIALEWACLIDDATAVGTTCADPRVKGSQPL